MGPHNYLEILVYRVHPGRREAFHHALQTVALKTMEGAGLTVVGFGPSSHDADTYFLLRAYPSLEFRARALEHYLSSPEWQQADAALAPLLQDCSTAVLPCEPKGIESLKHTIYF
jgi:quinol monooxygenase YgiN